MAVGEAEEPGDLGRGEAGGDGAQHSGMLLVHAGELLEQVELEVGRARGSLVHWVLVQLGWFRAATSGRQAVQ